jgi:hypothetical protein
MVVCQSRIKLFAWINIGKIMVLRTLILLLAFAMPAIAQEGLKAFNLSDYTYSDNSERVLTLNNLACNGCQGCRHGPSSADLVRTVQKMLNEDLLLQSRILKQLTELVRQIIIQERIGINGPTGPAGAPGTAGAIGLQGQAGTRGVRGVRGPIGPSIGPTGPIGTPGITGPIGRMGFQGPTGPAGPSDGPTGTIGPTGSVGATGASLGITDSAYIYNVSPQNVALNQDVTFDNGYLTTGAFLHTPGTAVIAVVDAGDYLVRFSLSVTEPNQFSLFVNGVAVPGSTYGSNAGTQQNTGQVIVRLAAGDIITVRNFLSTAGVSLQTLAGGTQTNTNASISILKLTP